MRTHPIRAFMRRAGAVARNERLCLRRQPLTVLVALAQPLVLLIVYGYCLNFDLRNLPFMVWDQDHSEPAIQLVRRLNTGGRQPTFHFEGYVDRPEEIEPILARGQARFVLVIPREFGRNIAAGRSVQVQALFDAADSNTAGVAAGYLGGAVAEHNLQLSIDAVARRHGADDAAPPFMGGTTAASGPLDLRWRVFYNPDLSSQPFIIPGLIVVLLATLAATLTSTTITRERELGSIESLVISPVGAADLVIGKMLPYIVLSAIDVALVVGLGYLFFHVWLRGSLFTLTALTLLFLPGNLAVGFVISAVSPTQQIALVFAILFAFLPSVFLTGFAFPRSNMYWPVQYLSAALPATQYLIATRGVYLKGVGWAVLWPQALWLAVSGAALVALAIGIMRAKLARGLE